MQRQPRRDAGPTLTFVHCAWLYWTEIWPLTCREISEWRARAAAIPNPTLRAAALGNLHDERGNLEGAAAFAVLAPRRRRRQLVRALVAFQAIYDYVDTLVERHDVDVEDAGRRLHTALRDALDASTSHPADCYYPRDLAEDDGYLLALVNACSAAAAAMPAAAAIAAPASAAVDRMVEYQVRNHATARRPSVALADWALQAVPAPTDFHWWEAAASTASSLVVFAMLALAADADTTSNDVSAVARAYVAVGALHVLLDSHADRDADAEIGDHSLVAHYADAATEARRLARIAGEARARAGELRRGETHVLILSAMASYYLVATGPSSRRLATKQLVGALGTSARAATAVLRTRRTASYLLTQIRSMFQSL